MWCYMLLILDGVLYLASFVMNAKNTAIWDGDAGCNVLDSGCPFYDTYRTMDGKFVAVGCLEPKFYANFIRLLGLDVNKYVYYCVVLIADGNAV